MIRIGTRSSPLAMTQAQLVVNAFKAAKPDMRIEIVPYTTTGDKTLQPLKDIGGKALFTKELQQDLLSGKIDGAVHSLKDVECHDLPLTFAAFLEREVVHDILIVNKDADQKGLTHPLTFGSCAPRRLSQMQPQYPMWNIVDLRGNVGTRLSRVQNKDIDATVLAAAGLHRLGYKDAADLTRDYPDLVWYHLNPAVFIPAAGQGIIAIETAFDKANLFEAIDHHSTHAIATLEREFTKCFHGNCRTAIGAHVWYDDGITSPYHGYKINAFYEGHYGTLDLCQDIKALMRTETLQRVRDLAFRLQEQYNGSLKSKKCSSY